MFNNIRIGNYKCLSVYINDIKNKFLYIIRFYPNNDFKKWIYIIINIGTC